jgi:hypothetical protein
MPNSPQVAIWTSPYRPGQHENTHDHNKDAEDKSKDKRSGKVHAEPAIRLPWCARRWPSGMIMQSRMVAPPVKMKLEMR